MKRSGMGAWLGGMLAFVLALAMGGSAEAQPKPTTKARLVLSAAEAKPGDAVMAGVELKMAAGWHTYWRNGGDAGMPTTIEWTLPSGAVAGEIHWPPPEKHVEQDIVSYIYHDSVVLLVPIKLAADTPPGPVQISAKVSWLECKTLCFPGDGETKAELVIGNNARPSPDAGLIQAWEAKQPKLEAPEGLSAYWDGAAKENARPIVLEWKTSEKPERIDFYPAGGEGYAIKGQTDEAPAEGGVALRKEVSSDEGKWPSNAAGLLVVHGKSSDEPAFYEINLPILEKGAAAPAPAGGAQRSNATAAPAPAPSLWLMLGFAFLGGLILNVMPCVLPVIALKILGFVQQSKEEPKAIRRLGALYGAGVLASFGVLAGVVILLQQAGQIVGWGVQFQNPIFLVTMTVLVLLIALNLFGVFEVTLGAGAMGAAGSLAAKEGGTGAFFNGVLATILATPCSAPYLGYALGFAFTQSAATILLMFMAIGLGLASPFVILSWQPAWLKLMPKPGVWMERFKKAMGFPMLATAVWLFWLSLSHFDSNGVLWLGLFLVVMALSAWIWGEFVQRSFSGRAFSGVLALALTGFGYWFALEHKLSWRSPAAVSVAAAEIPADKAGAVEWKPWSLEAVHAARAAGHVVLIDFTAKWCATCQWNKAAALNTAAVAEKLQAVKGVAFKADYTRRDPVIYEELKRHGRAAVPLNIVLPPDTNAPAIVLREDLFLTGPGPVLEALDQASGRPGQALTRVD